MSNPRYGGLCSCGRIAGHGGDCGAPAAFGGNPRLGEALAATRRELAEARAERDREREQKELARRALDAQSARALAAESGAEQFRGALRDAERLAAEGSPLLPSLKSIGELSENWTDEGERELADCLYGALMHFIEIGVAARAALSGTAAPPWKPEDALLKSQSHEFWQDSKYNRTAGRCDYTYPDGDYCGELASHPVHSSSTTAAAAETAPPPSGPAGITGGDHGTDAPALRSPGGRAVSADPVRQAGAVNVQPGGSGRDVPGLPPVLVGVHEGAQPPPHVHPAEPPAPSPSVAPPASAGDNPWGRGGGGSAGVAQSTDNAAVPNPPNLGAASVKVEETRQPLPAELPAAAPSKPEPGAPCHGCTLEALRTRVHPTYRAAPDEHTCGRDAIHWAARAAVPEEPGEKAKREFIGTMKDLHLSPELIAIAEKTPAPGAAPKVEDPLGDPFPTFESFVLRWAPSPPSAGAQFKAEAWALFIRDRSRLAALEEVARRARGWGNPELTAALAALDSLGGAKEGGK